MALLMAAGSEPLTDRERDDLDAIASLKESAAIELKELGNKHVKMGKRYYSDAIDCYSRAILQNSLSDSDQSVLFSNRAHVNLMLGNYRRAIADAEEAIRLCSTNVKAYYRGAKAAFSLELLMEAESFCKRGLEQFPTNEEMKQLSKRIDSRKKELEHHTSQILKVVESAEELASAFKTRGLKLGKALYEELTGLQKPKLDKSGNLHWPVLLLYPEVMSSDFIEEFCESDMFSAHLDMMYSDGSSTLPWDKENAYTREAIELFYQANTGVVLSKTKVLQYLLLGTGTSLAECGYNDDEDEVDHTKIPSSLNSGEWRKVNEKKKLTDILQQSDYIIPAIPVFVVVSRRSGFYKEFRAGNWSQP
ncbi:tetratricopeptide repeat protein 4 homolog [Phalaenopsis equestris]|uniref:tetratricopeptide repeat protein 4 homolog n=1 Tax=Phalaenopsis equestris TaxID=78828 RepID=UPI0009E30210|nr:tetratricopeptide repeat protein 4 homolog [Phalaenopsis equestris]